MNRCNVCGTFYNQVHFCTASTTGLTAVNSFGGGVVEITKEELARLHDEMHQMTHNCVGAEMERDELKERLQKIEQAGRDIVFNIDEQILDEDPDNTNRSIVIRVGYYRALAAALDGK